MSEQTEVAVYKAASLDDRWRYAQAIAQAGNLVPPGLRDGNQMNPGKVLMAMEQASLLGFHPMVGVNNINVIDGKVSIPPALMQACVRRAGHTLRVRKEGTVEGGDFAVTAILIRSDDPDWEFTATWTPQRAERAGLCTYREEGGKWVAVSRSNSGRALPWEQYTEAMCKARAISEVVMEGATDVMMGSVYTPEELGAVVNAAGEVVDAEVVDAYSPAATASHAAAEATVATDTPVGPGEADTGADSEAEAIAAQWAEAVEACSTSVEVKALWADAQSKGAMGVEVAPGVSLREAMTSRGSLLAEAEAAALVQSELGASEVVEGGDENESAE